MDNPACENCQFFRQPGDPEYAKHTGYGLCVRYPQAIEQLKGYWCGEFRPASAVVIKEPSKRKP